MPLRSSSSSASIGPVGRGVAAVSRNLKERIMLIIVIALSTDVSNLLLCHLQAKRQYHWSHGNIISHLAAPTYRDEPPWPYLSFTTSCQQPLLAISLLVHNTSDDLITASSKAPMERSPQHRSPSLQMN